MFRFLLCNGRISKSFPQSFKGKCLCHRFEIIDHHVFISKFLFLFYDNLFCSRLRKSCTHLTSSLDTISLILARLVGGSHLFQPWYSRWESLILQQPVQQVGVTYSSPCTEVGVTYSSACTVGGSHLFQPWYSRWESLILQQPVQQVGVTYSSPCTEVGVTYSSACTVGGSHLFQPWYSRWESLFHTCLKYF